MNGYEIVLIIIAVVALAYILAEAAIRVFGRLLETLKLFKLNLEENIKRESEFIKAKSIDKKRVNEARAKIVEYKHDKKIARAQERLKRIKDKDASKIVTLDTSEVIEDKEDNKSARPNKEILLEKAEQVIEKADIINDIVEDRIKTPMPEGDRPEIEIKATGKNSIAAGGNITIDKD